MRSLAGRSASVAAAGLLLVLSVPRAAAAQGTSGFCRDLGGGCGTIRVRCSALPNLGCNEFGVRVSGLGFLFPVGALVFGQRANPSIPLLPMPGCPSGCRLFVLPPVVVVPFRASRFGITGLTFPVPNDPSLIGSELAAQAARADEQGCLQVSNGLAIHLGVGPCG